MRIVVDAKGRAPERPLRPKFPIRHSGQSCRMISVGFAVNQIFNPFSLSGSLRATAKLGRDTPDMVSGPPRQSAIAWCYPGRRHNADAAPDSSCAKFGGTPLFSSPRNLILSVNYE
jgi:hypothetical protein